MTYAEAFGALNSRHDAGGRKVTMKGAVGSGRKGSRQSESRSEHMYALDVMAKTVLYSREISVTIAMGDVEATGMSQYPIDQQTS
jgi:hypothetical protein